MKIKTYQKIVFFSALYDFIVTVPFMFPVIVAKHIDTLQSLHHTLNFQGQFPEFYDIHYFFLNLFGSIVCVWSVLRMKNPLPINGLFDSFGRFLFSLWMMFYFLQGATQLLLVFFVPEIIWGIIQFWGYFKTKKKSINETLSKSQTV